MSGGELHGDPEREISGAASLAEAAAGPAPAVTPDGIEAQLASLRATLSGAS